MIRLVDSFRIVPSGDNWPIVPMRVPPYCDGHLIQIIEAFSSGNATQGDIAVIGGRVPTAMTWA
jgi:hypothetical protein